MLSKDKRLNLKKEFKWVINGSKLETPSLRLYLRSTSDKPPQVGISLSKKYFKSAVERNRARRLASWGVENLYSQLPKGLKLIIMPKSLVLEKKSQELLKELQDVLHIN